MQDLIPVNIALVKHQCNLYRFTYIAKDKNIGNIGNIDKNIGNIERISDNLMIAHQAA
nr:hypothetical protein RMONA_1575 [Rickettsia monacensis IrR/Munich]